jgi:hypothetical protein
MKSKLFLPERDRLDDNHRDEPIDQNGEKSLSNERTHSPDLHHHHHDQLDQSINLKREKFNVKSEIDLPNLDCMIIISMNLSI